MDLKLQRQMGRIIRGIKYPSIVANLLKNRIKATGLDYHWGKGYSFPPINIYHNLTFRCNLHCIFCDYQKQSRLIHFPNEKRAITEELSWPELRSVIDNYAVIRPNVILSGGVTCPYRIGPMEMLVLDSG